MHIIDLVKYKGYYGAIEYCPEDNLFFAYVVGIGSSSIICRGDSLEQVKEEFKISIDFHLDVSEAEGWTPYTTDPEVTREMDALLSKKSDDGLTVAKSSRSLAYAH